MIRVAQVVLPAGIDLVKFKPPGANLDRGGILAHGRGADRGPFQPRLAEATSIRSFGIFNAFPPPAQSTRRNGNRDAGTPVRHIFLKRAAD
jgi:hypothetical protein